MKVQNFLAISDEEFLADSIRHWQEALAKNDMATFAYWAVHALCFAREMLNYAQFA